jgi:pantetheine-phosphate adenylyltransferase
MKAKAIYAASLDPITFGHLWLINEGMQLFEELIVCVAVNPNKAGKYMFSVEERLHMTRFCMPPCVRVASIGPNYLVDFVKQEKATHLLRGVRNAEDFSVESTMAEINRRMALGRGIDVETVMLSPPHELSIVSSSFVKSLIGYEGWKKEIRKYIPEHVAIALEERTSK